MYLYDPYSNWRRALSDSQRTLSKRGKRKNILSTGKQPYSNLKRALTNTERTLSNRQEPYSDLKRVLSNTERTLFNRKEPYSNLRRALSKRQRTLSKRRRILSNRKQPYRAVFKFEKNHTEYEKNPIQNPTENESCRRRKELDPLEKSLITLARRYCSNLERAIPNTKRTLFNRKEPCRS